MKNIIIVIVSLFLLSVTTIYAGGQYFLDNGSSVETVCIDGYEYVVVYAKESIYVGIGVSVSITQSYVKSGDYPGNIPQPKQCR